jgi:predicted nucleic acid-binding Zn ribbon protein
VPVRSGPAGSGSPESGSAGPAKRGAPDRARLAVEALAEAQADARARGDLPAGLARGTGTEPKTERAGISPSGTEDQPGRRRVRRDDPQLLTSAINGLLEGRGWQQRAAMGSVFGRWAEIVGTDLAAHTQPDSYADGELTVTADSTAWATQVRLLAPMLVRRLNTELGDGSVRRVKVRGPAPPRQRGGWRVPGSKGPGDTYG